MEAGLATVARAMSRPCQNLSRCHRQRFHSGQLGSMPPWSGSEAHTAVHGSCMAPPICMCIPCTHRSVHCVWCMHAYICMHMHAYACICMHMHACSALIDPCTLCGTGPHLDCVPRLTYSLTCSFAHLRAYGLTYRSPSRLRAPTSTRHLRHRRHLPRRPHGHLPLCRRQPRRRQLPLLSLLFQRHLRHRRPHRRRRRAHPACTRLLPPLL